jgi:glycosyltransferase involved in cell wall biosynthesis
VTPLVSVIIPVLNGERYLAEALESVFLQTRVPDEVVVVDDGSTDATSAVARLFENRIRYVRQEHGGIGPARNRGLRESTGSLVAFLDHDDLWTVEKLDLQVRALEASPATGMIFGLVEEFVSPDLPAHERARLLLREGRHPGYLAGAMLARRSAFAAAGDFPAAFRAGEFIDWYLRAVESGVPHALLPHLVLKRRLHMTNTGRGAIESRTDFARVLKNSLDRRRRGAAGATLSRAADPAHGG